jgi:Domain of unknown function (DUF6398)
LTAQRDVLPNALGFFHSIKLGDVVVARYGTGKRAAVGTVIRTAYYDPDNTLAGLETGRPLPEPMRESPVAKRRSPGVGIAEDVRPAFEEIIGLVEAFCRGHLNEEYAGLCRRLTEKLARKRPSPLVSGRASTWACGIVRTIGWVNFLDDRSQTPHLKLTAIDRAFGVGESTGQGKSMLIRRMLKIRPMDPAWSLRRRMDQNPMAWMIQVNGFLVDARLLKREIQEEALRKGLIPYIPERRPIGEDDEAKDRSEAE